MTYLNENKHIFDAYNTSNCDSVTIITLIKYLICVDMYAVDVFVSLVKHNINNYMTNFRTIDPICINLVGRQIVSR